MSNYRIVAMLLIAGLSGHMCSNAAAAVRIEGVVQAGRGPLAMSTVTLWAAGTGAPKQLAQTKTGGDGRFELGSQENPGKDEIVYLIAKGASSPIPIVVPTAQSIAGLPPSGTVCQKPSSAVPVWAKVH